MSSARSDTASNSIRCPVAASIDAGIVVLHEEGKVPPHAVAAHHPRGDRGRLVEVAAAASSRTGRLCAGQNFFRRGAAKYPADTGASFGASNDRGFVNRRAVSVLVHRHYGHDPIRRHYAPQVLGHEDRLKVAFVLYRGRCGFSVRRTGNVQRYRVVIRRSHPAMLRVPTGTDGLLKPVGDHPVQASPAPAGPCARLKTPGLRALILCNQKQGFLLGADKRSRYQAD